MKNTWDYWIVRRSYISTKIYSCIDIQKSLFNLVELNWYELTTNLGEIGFYHILSNFHAPISGFKFTTTYWTGRGTIEHVPPKFVTNSFQYGFQWSKSSSMKTNWRSIYLAIRTNNRMLFSFFTIPKMGVTKHAPNIWQLRHGFVSQPLPIPIGGCSITCAYSWFIVDSYHIIFDGLIWGLWLWYRCQFIQKLSTCVALTNPWWNICKKPDTKLDFLWFSYDRWKRMFVDFLIGYKDPPNCVHYWA